MDELRAAHLGNRPVDPRIGAAELSCAMSRPPPVRRRRRAVKPG
ncbi:hypothetical protein ACIHFD_46965 [Nonomuraea sp. NPDC051941]